jgi:hypothetical protein
MKPLRVVQWATGNIGARALRGVIEHPGLELAGVYVTSPAKAGKDAGDLCGVAATGVLATADLNEILALGADCVLYMPAACSLDEVCALLASGANIVTTRGEFHHPGSMDPANRARVEAACAAGGTSIHSTGSSPGFISEALPLALTSIQRRLDSLTISEFADLSKRNSPDLLFNLMGFGKRADEFDRRRFGYGAISFGPSLRLLAEALGTPLDSVESTGEVAVAREAIRIAAGPLAAGTVAAQKMIVTGLRNGRPLLTFAATCTAPPTWTRPGMSAQPAGASSSTATRRSTSTSASPSRSSGWATRPLATPLTARSTPSRSSARPRRASGPRPTCPRSSPTWPSGLPQRRR